jgi:GT2 family glycosyltransferase
MIPLEIARIKPFGPIQGSAPAPQVSIVIPTLNHIDLLRRCLTSIQEYTDLGRCEVIVVANGCTDGTLDYLKTLPPPFRHLVHEQPMGFTAAVNAGIREARGQYVCLLNNDTVLLPQAKNAWIELLIDPFKKDPKVGITGPVKFHWDLGGIERRAIAFWCAMIPKRLFGELGLPDEAFSPGMGEDGDFSIKAEMAGYRLVQVPIDRDGEFGKGVADSSFPIFHLGSGTFRDKDYSEVKKRNDAILLARYGRKDGERAAAAGVTCSIIIPTVDHFEDALKPCVEAVLKYTDLSDKEVIVVANGSPKEAVAWLKTQPVLLVEHPERLGYIRAVNAGIEAATGEYVVTLDDDSFLQPQERDQWMKALMAPFQEDPKVAASSPFSTVYEDLGQVLHSGCTMYRASALRKIGLFDEAFNPGYMGDEDLSIRLRKAGYLLAEIPKGHTNRYVDGFFQVLFPVVHTGTINTMDKHGADLPLVERNRKLLYERHLARPKVSIVVIPTVDRLRGRLQPCIESIRTHTNLEGVEIVVVANGSPKEAEDHVRGLGAPFRLLSFPETLSFAKAANEGIRAAKGEYVLIFSDDVLLLDQRKNAWMELLLGPFEKQTGNVGMTGPVKRVWNCGGIKRQVMDFWCVLLSRKLLDEVGLLDESLNPGTGADWDLAARAERAGYRLVQVPVDVSAEVGKWFSDLSFPIYQVGSPTSANISPSQIAKNIAVLVERYGPKDRLEEIYRVCLGHECDTNRLFPTLRSYAEQCRHITEFGVRGVFTSWAFLASRPRRMVSYDIEYNGNIEEAKDEARKAAISFEFVLKDVLEAVIEPTDLLFIDTKHTYVHLKAELTRHASSVGKYILIHDTESFGEKGEDGGPGELKAIEEFLAEDPEWEVRERITISNGLVVLARKPISQLPGTAGSPVVEKESAPASHPRISIIIPTYQHLEELLKPCLQSLIDHTRLDDAEVIVVANGCTDGTEDYVRSLGAPFKVVSFPDPLGFTKATNEGLKVATGDYLILYNNDNELLPQLENQWLDWLLEPFEKDPKTGITGPLQLHDDYADEDVIIGFCLCVSRKALQEAMADTDCLLDETFSPGGGEDIDLCCKVRRKGYIVRQVPHEGKLGFSHTNTGEFMIWHKNNQTFKDIPEYTRWFVKRNGFYNMKRYNNNIKLNLGSGGMEYPGYLSVDLHDKRAAIIMDVTKIDLDDNSVAEILAIHVFEHLNPYKALGILKEWHRVLKPGGKLIMEMPDIEQLCRRFVTAPTPERYGILNAVYGSVNTTGEGDPSDITSPHLFGWWQQSLRDHLTNAGFVDVVFGPEQYPHPESNLHVEAQKPRGGSMVGLWNYEKCERPVPSGDDTTYRKAMEFLHGCATVEDWGCGTAYARTFMSGGKYIGIDGSPSKFCDFVTDLRLYKSMADGILIRHVLDHNPDWRTILANAIASFQKKLVFIIFTPFGETTKRIATNWNDIPDLSFRKEDLTDLLKGLPYTEESVRTATQYGVEHLFYITRP